MDVIIAKTAGFCWGVKRAVNMALEAQVRSKGSVFTHGPLIHNRRVVEYLKKKGIEVYDNTVSGKKGETLIIRAHGLPPKQKQELVQKWFNLIDATCPHVVHAQKEVEKYYKSGYQIVITGDRNHAEVIGLNGCALGQAVVVDSAEEAEHITIHEPILLIAQSTFNEDEFKDISTIFKKKYSKIIIKNTICKATSTRQKEIVDLAKEVDAIVVVGDRISANTSRLVSIARAQKKPVYFVEGADEIHENKMKNYSIVGVTAGASTPEWETALVIKRLKSIK